MAMVSRRMQGDINMTGPSSDTLASKTWTALGKASLSRTPENYHLWYCHLSGDKPALSLAINNLVSEYGHITDADCAGLYEQFFTAERVSKEFLSHIGSLLGKVKLLEQRVTHGKNPTLDDNELKRWDETAANILPQAVQALQLERVEVENWLDEAVAVVKGLRREAGNNLSPVHMDALTGLADKSSFSAELQIRVEISSERSEPLSLALIQIHHQTDIADETFTMQELARVLNGAIKGRDYLARSGEWELAMVLPRTRLSQAERLCQNILSELDVIKTHPKNGWMWSETVVGIGLAQLHFPETPTKLLSRARDCLTYSLDKGRDNIVCEDSPRNDAEVDVAAISLFPLSGTK